VINNIKTKLIPLEWINLELKWIFYELNKFFVFIFILKKPIFFINSEFLKGSELGTIFLKRLGVNS
jgi:hypothetical protein